MVYVPAEVGRSPSYSWRRRELPCGEGFAGPGRIGLRFRSLKD
jgi:hypothetical protein